MLCSASRACEWCSLLFERCTFFMPICKRCNYWLRDTLIGAVLKWCSLLFYRCSRLMFIVVLLLYRTRTDPRLSTGCGTPSDPSWLLLYSVVWTTSGLYVFFDDSFRRPVILIALQLTKWMHIGNTGSSRMGYNECCILVWLSNAGSCF